jgi:hypothetical protein
MRILLSILALAFMAAAASAQSTATEKKNRKAVKAEAVTIAPEAETPKAACCAGKASGDKAACAGKADMKADATHGTVPAEGHSAAAEGAPKAACCAGKAKADKGGCHGKAEAHSHDAPKGEEAPANE